MTKGHFPFLRLLIEADDVVFVWTILIVVR